MKGFPFSSYIKSKIGPKFAIWDMVPSIRTFSKSLKSRNEYKVGNFSSLNNGEKIGIQCTFC